VLDRPIDDHALLMTHIMRTRLEKKQSQDALQSARDALASQNCELEARAQAQRELIQFLAHDLKNQLFVVLGNLDWARATSPKDHPEFISALDEGINGALRLRAMIEDLLAVSNLEDANFRVHPERVTTSELLRPILAAYERKAESKHIALSKHGEDCTLHVDPALLRRVFENLLDNALRYTPTQGQVAVKLQTAPHDAALVEISISNSGPAIAPEDRERIFEKFARGHSSTAALGNAGIGLYFCRLAVEAHAGRIYVIEIPEWPTRFVVQLPKIE